MNLLASIRPDSWNFPLFLHVLGAMVLVGGTLTAASTLVFGRNDERLLRLGYWSLLAVSLPGFIVMRIGAQWIYSKEFPNEPENGPTWVGIGYLVADAGALLLLIALIVGGIGVYRLRSNRGSGLVKASLAISVLLLAAYIVAVWAMSAKPD